MAGFASAGGKSSSKKARNAIIGTAVGGGIASATQGNRMGMLYAIDLGGGSSIQVVTDQTEIRVGDCVSVERSGSGAVNVRRASAALCTADDTKVDDDIIEQISKDAQVCADPRSKLLEAEDDASIQQAALKINILCNS